MFFQGLMQSSHHPAWVQMRLVGKEQALLETSRQGWLKGGDGFSVDPFIGSRARCKAAEFGHVSRLGKHERALVDHL